MTKPYVTFEPIEHIYTLSGDGDDRILPSVTQILQDNNLGFDFNRLTNIDLAWHQDKGVKTHLACEYLDKGILDWKSVAPEILGYVKSYQLGKHEYKFEVLETEMIVFDKLHRFAGTLDRIIRFHQSQVVAQFDIKSGMPHVSHGDQTAGYNICLDDTKYSRHIPRYGLYLDKDGGLPKLKAYSDLNDFVIFESAVNLYYARRRNG